MRRDLHPWAWWGWAIAVAVAAGLTTNPVLLIGLGTGVLAVVVLRRGDAPWARSLRVYAALAATVLAVRVAAQAVLGAVPGDHVVLTLPAAHLPDWAAGIRIGGPVTAEALLYATFDAMRLGLVLLCVGAANTLADPRRALRSVPAALHDVSVAVVISLTLAPQLIESAGRVRRARRLRGDARRGVAGLRRVLLPVVEDAVDRSMALASGMEARGYGRVRTDVPGLRLGGALSTAGLGLLCLGMFLLLGSTHTAPAVACLAAGVLASAAGLRLSGRGQIVTRYRPDPWGAPEWAVIGSGALAAAVVAGPLAAIPDMLRTPTGPPQWPAGHPWMLVAVACVLVPLLVVPDPYRRPAASGAVVDGAAEPVAPPAAVPARTPAQVAAALRPRPEPAAHAAHPVGVAR